MDSEEETLYGEVESGDESSRDDSDDSDDFAEEAETKSPTGRQIEVDENPYEVLSTEEIVQHMVDSVREVNIVMQIPETTARILLNHFKWDKIMLMERFYDGDQDQLFAEARVINPSLKPTVVNKSKLKSAAGTEKCEICFRVLLSSTMTGLECGHRFCTQCWREYLTTKIMEEGVGQTIACAAHRCNILVDDATVMRLVRDTKVKLKYQRLITNSFVQCSSLLRWCPSPDCNNAIKVHYLEARPVTCKCTHTFCFACGKNWHDPVKCHLLRKWMNIYSDLRTFNWIAVNTKECPNCNVSIEKNGGCNHIVCKIENCNASFCWLCLGPWNSLYYSCACNRYAEEKAETGKAEKDSQSELKRKLFFYNRYRNHMQSLKFEHKLYASVEEKMKEMQRNNVLWFDVKFLKETVDILCQCRQTLMYTYVFAYYLRRNNQFMIFAENQNDLEGATEALSEYLERDITSENVADIKRKVTDKYIYCDRRRKILLEHVYEGYEKDWWEFTE
jgi:ariadne-1